MHRSLCFCMLVVVNVFISTSSTFKADFEVVIPIRVHVPTTPDEQNPQKTDEGNRRKRQTSSVDRSSIVNTINSLRSSVGSSDMNYLTYSTTLETYADNWTSYCDYDADFYGYSAGIYAIKGVTADYTDYVDHLNTVFYILKFYNGLRSVYLRGIGAATTYCSQARVKGAYRSYVYLTLFSFSGYSNFNENMTQFALGEECTTCQSGSFWCYEKLCRDGCTDSDSDCYCNSYCLNCAATDSTTCRCRCRDGWIGSRCETAIGVNTTTPTCSTTPRIPRTSTTPSTTSRSTVAPTTASTTSASTVASTTASTTSKSMDAPTTPSTTSRSTVAMTTAGTTSKSNAAASRNSASGSSIGKSLVRLGFYAAVALLLRMCTVFI